ncbi:hypothetical protein MJM25_30125, partial [Salmonella enterica subsp. enterica serovar Lubbock]|nr:hypothetical protein [Salmonella enterica subsp. enterica serovar Lubbock]
NSTFSQDEIVNGHATLPDRTKGVFGGGVAIGYDFYDPFQLPVLPLTNGQLVHDLSYALDAADISDARAQRNVSFICITFQHA